MLSDEEAKALQELSKAASANPDIVRRAMSFLSDVIGQPSRQISGLVGDVVGILRLEILMKYQERVERISRERRIDIRGRLPLALAYPLLEAASLEEDDDISEMYANLLVSYAEGNREEASGGGARFLPKEFIQSLKSMTPFEAEVLKSIYLAPNEYKNGDGKLCSIALPHEYMPIPENRNIVEIPFDLEIALVSLHKNKFIEAHITFGGWHGFDLVGMSLYGETFMRACYGPR